MINITQINTYIDREQAFVQNNKIVCLFVDHLRIGTPVVIQYNSLEVVNLMSELYYRVKDEI